MAILHPGQSPIFHKLFVERACRYATAVCSRGYGKSYLAAVAASAAVMELLALHKNVPNKRVFIIAPTFDQVTDIYYPILTNDLGMHKKAISSSRYDGVFIFKNGVELHLVSYESIERLRGKGAYFVVCDEVSSWLKGIGFKNAWEQIIWPCINTRWSRMHAKMYRARSPGRALIISTPKGYNFLYDMYNMPEWDNDFMSWHYDYTQSPYLDPEEIERARLRMDPISFAQEYLATFKESGNLVFHQFDRKIHVTREIVPMREKEDVHVGIDFNVGIMASSAFTLRAHQMHYHHEFKGLPDTDALATMLALRYKEQGHRVLVYPDPTGKARKTSAPIGQSDLTILSDAGFTVVARSSSPPIVDSVKAVNRMLMNANGDVNMFFHPEVDGVIKSMERTRWMDNNPDTLTIDKSDKIEHFSDGVRYPTEILFPAHRSGGVTARSERF